MATKSLIVSDLSGTEIADGDHAVVVIEHQGYTSPLEIDVTVAEADKLQTSKLDLVHLTITHDGKSRKVVIDAKAFEKIVPEAVLESARKAYRQPEAKTRAARGTGAKASGEKRDYSSPEWGGVEHRGRTTEAEAAWVRANLEQANANRAREGQAPIDPNDEKMKKRYGF